jgi:hypothetical protein
MDLDNQWSYMKTHGDRGWESFPSYFEIVVPRILEVLDDLNLTITFFLVGQDAALEKNRAVLSSIAKAGHEIGNHSFRHEPWLHLYSPKDLERELADAQEAIRSATGNLPTGFRGPGFSVSAATIQTLADLGFSYDASTFPTFIGPLARAYYFMHATLSGQQREHRNRLFGTVGAGLLPITPYRWDSAQGLLELPVTTMPFLKIPFHLSYILYLSRFSPTMALSYFRLGLRLCRLANVQPSILLHPLDFLGSDDLGALSFFPAMDLSSSRKVATVRAALRVLATDYSVVTVAQHAATVAADDDIAIAKSSVFHPITP